MKIAWAILPLVASAVASTRAWLLLDFETAPLCYAIGLVGGVFCGLAARDIDDGTPNGRTT